MKKKPKKKTNQTGKRHRPETSPTESPTNSVDFFNTNLDEIACPLHKAAIQTKHIKGEYTSYNTMNDFRPVTEEERKQMVLLEKNLDFCVLRSRIDYENKRDGNENNSIKASSGRRCPPYGDISSEYKKEFKAQEKLIKSECEELKQTFIEFPSIDMRNEFSTHWKRQDDDCEKNSFTLKHAKTFDLNHFKYNFDRYKQLRDGDTSLTSIAAFRQSIEEIRDKSDYWYETDPNNYAEIRGSFEVEYKLRQNRKIKPSDSRHLFFTSPDIESVGVNFVDKIIPSRYGLETIKERLGIDSRLLHKENFTNLDCPPICIPSIARSGTADFHCVYFESQNAMGQLNKWVTIIVVRKSEREEYAQRYASPHTFIVSLEERDKKVLLQGIANTAGYSAGDSKYYCWRIANWLHDEWGTPDNRRRCVIMDDQVAPFGHQVPIFTENEDYLGPKSKNYKYCNTDPKTNEYINPENNQYEFRTTLVDKRGHNLMYSGNSRWYLTHAATFMYMDRVCDVMKAAIVCMTSGVQKQDFPLSPNPKSNVVWFIDLDKMNKALHTEDEHHIECGIHPAYQAGEDLFMHVINKNRNLRSVKCNTIRWRSRTTGGGTCGRGGIKPFQPIVKYWELSTILQYNDNAVKIAKVQTIPNLTTGTTKKHQIKEITPVWGADKIVYKHVNNTGECKDQLLNIWVKKGNIIFKASLNVNAENPCYFGSKTVIDSKLTLSNPYAPRHIFTNIAMQLLTKCIAAKQHKKQKHKKHKKHSQIRYPFTDCKQGYVYSDQDGDNIYYLRDGRVDVYDSFFVPLDNNFMTRQQFASVNKDAILSEIGQYSEKDVYHEPEQGDNIRYLFEDDDGINKWYNGVIIRVDSGEYTVKYDSDAEPTLHRPGTFSKNNFNKHWKFAK